MIIYNALIMGRKDSLIKLDNNPKMKIKQ